MMIVFRFLPVLLIVLARLAGRVLGKPSFVTPPPFTKDSYQDNPTYELGRNVSVELADVATHQGFGLYVVLEYLPRNYTETNWLLGTFEAVGQDESTTAGMDWRVDLNGHEASLSPGESAICYLALKYEEDLIYSAYFNVSKPISPESSTTTASIASTTSSQPATLLSLSTAAPSTVPTSAATSQNTKPVRSLSTGAFAGIAVGSAIGGLILLYGSFYVVRKYLLQRSNKDTRSRHELMSPEHYQDHPKAINEHGISELEVAQTFEMDSQQAVEKSKRHTYELP